MDSSACHRVIGSDGSLTGYGFHGAKNGYWNTKIPRHSKVCFKVTMKGARKTHKDTNNFVTV
jgi:hypothetical protein